MFISLIFFPSIAHPFVNLICCSRTSFLIFFYFDPLIFSHSVESRFAQNFHALWVQFSETYSSHLYAAVFVSLFLWRSFCLSLLFSCLTRILVRIFICFRLTWSDFPWWFPTPHTPSLCIWVAWELPYKNHLSVYIFGCI